MLRVLTAAALFVPALACSKGDLHDTYLGDAGPPPAPESLDLPRCLDELVASCAPTGMCSFAVGAGFPHDVCFASGVRVTFDSMALDGLGCGNSFRARVTRPDGSLCYVFDRYHDETKTCADFRYTWYDAEGRIVASATKSAGDNPDLTVFCRLSHYGLTSNCDIGSSDPSCCDIDSAGAASCGADLPYGRCTEDGCP